MKMVKVLILLALATLVAASGLRGQEGSGAGKAKLYNTTKQKLLDGKQVFSFTQSKFDPAGYCEKAKHYDYTWFEMQHSTLEFKDIEAMIAACPHVAATPMIRLPDAQEWHIQHATDIGVLGIVVPTVDDVERAQEAVKWSRYSPGRGPGVPGYHIHRGRPAVSLRPMGIEQSLPPRGGWIQMEPPALRIDSVLEIRASRL